MLKTASLTVAFAATLAAQQPCERRREGDQGLVPDPAMQPAERAPYPVDDHQTPLSTQARKGARRW